MPPSVTVADVPDAPAAVGVGIAGLDCLHPLGASVAVPQGEVGALVAVGPDAVGGFEGHGHGSFRFDGISLQGQGISQAPGRTLL